MVKPIGLKKTLVEQILDKAHIAYEQLELDALQSTDLPVEAQVIFKTLALSGNKSGPIIGLIPLTKHLSEKKLAKISNNKKVQMIPQKDLQKTTGYVHGANNPVGIRQKHRFPIYIDQSALDLGEIVVSSGELGRSIRIKSQDLADFVQASFADLIDD